MKREPPSLMIYRELLPSLERAKAEGRVEFDDPDAPLITVDVIAEELTQAEIFDCRNLPFEFVRDTGDATWDDRIAHPQVLRLPFEKCYFEWDMGDHQIACHACEADLYQNPDDDKTFNEYRVDAKHHHGKPIATILEIRAFFDTPGRPFKFEVLENWPAHARFLNGAEAHQYDGLSAYSHTPQEDRFFSFYDLTAGTADYGEHGIQQQKGREIGLFLAAHLLLGTLELLNQKLLTQIAVADPAPRLTAARAKRGKYPRSGGYFRLDVNVPAMRRMARAPLGTHESPALHWRRGHERVLHRGSEFEGRTWVRKCLVGDPDKGFVGKSYRLVHEMPMLPASNVVPLRPPVGSD
jgi:hypothetical protein